MQPSLNCARQVQAGQQAQAIQLQKDTAALQTRLAVLREHEEASAQCASALTEQHRVQVVATACAQSSDEAATLYIAALERVCTQAAALCKAFVGSHQAKSMQQQDNAEMAARVRQLQSVQKRMHDSSGECRAQQGAHHNGRSAWQHALVHLQSMAAEASQATAASADQSQHAQLRVNYAQHELHCAQVAAELLLQTWEQAAAVQCAQDAVHESAAQLTKLMLRRTENVKAKRGASDGAAQV